MPTSSTLLKQIQSKDFVRASETFNAIMQDKLKSAIQNEYVDVSRMVFTAPAPKSGK